MPQRSIKIGKVIAAASKSPTWSVLTLAASLLSVFYWARWMYIWNKQYSCKKRWMQRNTVRRVDQWTYNYNHNSVHSANFSDFYTLKTKYSTLESSKLITDIEQSVCDVRYYNVKLQPLSNCYPTNHCSDCEQTPRDELLFSRYFKLLYADDWYFYIY